MKTKFLLSSIASFALLTIASSASEIRFTADVPFGDDGRRIETVWKKADTCVRFVTVNTADVALYQSEAQLLFDDRNVYVSLTGFFDKEFECSDRNKPLDESNNFEFMIKPEGGSEIHVIVDEFARRYVARDRAEVQDAGVVVHVDKGDGCWTANLTIPFASLGASAPSDDLKAKVGIFRQNVNVHVRQVLHRAKRTCEVSGYTPNDYNFSVSDNWADVVFTRRDGVSSRVSGPNLGRRINLFSNPDFDVPGRPWSPCGGTVLQETQAMSGEWIYHSSGVDYQVLTGRSAWLKPNTRYTLVVKARSFGAGSALRIVEQTRDAEGELHEGVRVTGLTPVGPDMHEYYLPFTSSPDELWRFVFYKVDGKTADTGIDFASIRLYEGEVSSFEIRRQVRSGRMTPVSGTEVPVPPCAYGRMAKSPHVFVVVSSKYLTREPDDIFAGTGAEVDALLSQGKDQDVYETDGDPSEILTRLNNGIYDIYMIPRGGADSVGKELAAKILANVRKGAGLYLEHSEKWLHFTDVVKDGACGNGCVFFAKTAGRYHGYLPSDDLSEYGKSFFPRHVFRNPQVVADVVRTAFGEVGKGMRTRRRSFVYGGVRHEATWTLDAVGNTLAWRHDESPIAGAKLGAFFDDGDVSSIALDGNVDGLTVRWAFSDFSGRILARGEVAAAAKVDFRVPREKLYTNYGGIRLEIVRNGDVLDQRGECVFAANNDRERLFADYTPSMWPGTCPLDDVPAMNRRLEEIGIRSSVIPSGGTPAFEQYLACGLSVGGNWLAAWPLHGGFRQKSRVRTPNFNTEAWRVSARKHIREETARTAKFGLFQNALCDEPGLSAMTGDDELDAHPENLAEYRRRMETKYGTIMEYNRRHKTAHRSFADVGECLQSDARASGNPAEFIEWRNFNVDRWCEAIRLVSDAARIGDPNVPFSMCNSFGQSALSGNDYWKLLTRSGIGMSQEYTAMVYFGRGPINNFDEFLRSFRPDMRVWGWTGYFYTEDRARFMPWWTACHRYGGFSWYAANNPGYNLIDPKTFALTEDGRDLKASLNDSRLMDGLGRAFLDYDWVKRDVAIYYSHDSMLLATIRGPETKNREIAVKSPLHDYMYSRQGVQYLIEDILYQHDFVAPEQVVGGKLGGYKVLFMPRITAMSDAEVAAVKSFLANGGKVVADELPGSCDELGVVRTKNPFAEVSGVTVTGGNFDDLDRKQRVMALKLLAAASARPVLRSETIIDVFGREAMHFTDGTNDLFAIIRHPARSQDDATETFRFPHNGFVWDVRTRRNLGFTDRVTTKVPHAGAVVFAVMPYEAKTLSFEELRIIGGSSTEGRMVSIGLRLVAEGEPVGTHEFHVRLIPPSGVCRFHFQRNLTAKGGFAHLDFPLAFNDEIGVWKVIAEDALTGLRAERNLHIARQR